jgi:ABC-2 type transport system permease protein
MAEPIDRGPPLPPSLWRVVWLLCALDARRFLNRGPLPRRKNAAKRGATQRKGAPAKLLLLVVSVVLVINVLSNATRIVYGVATAAERASAPADAFVPREVLTWLDDILAGHRPTGIVFSTQQQQLDELFDFTARHEFALDPADRAARVAELRHTFESRGRAGFHETRLEQSLLPSRSLWFAGGAPRAMVVPLALISFLLVLSVLCFSVVGSDRDLARSDAALEWWFSFPVPTRALLLARILGATLVNPVGWLLLTPFFLVVFWCAGYGPYVGLLLAAAASSYLTMLGGCLRVVAETSLRRFLAPRRVSHVQAGLEVLSAVPLLAVFMASSKPGLDYVITHSRGLPLELLFNPLSLPFAWLLPRGAPAPFLAVAFLIAAVYGSIAVGSAMLRDGLVTASEPVSGSRVRRPVADGVRRSLMRVLVAREWLAIIRDPARVGRVLIFPLALIAMSALTNFAWLHSLISAPEHASAAAFGVGTFVLVGGGLVTLANEGPGLWMFYTVPWSLDALLARRAAFWAAIACAGVLTTLVTLASIAKDPRFVFSAHGALALVGIGIYGFVAVALGALGTDVMESSRARRVQPFTPQLFLLLTGMFTFALYSPSAWVKFAQLTLSALFAFALWQKLRDHTPYFLDPTEAPPPSIAVSDGIFAALAFFVLQGLLGFLFLRLRFSPGLVLVFSFAGAGLLVSAAAVWTLFRIGVPELARTLGLASPGRPLRTVSLGVVAGLVAGGGALLYTRLIHHIEWLQRLYDESERMEPTPSQLPWLAGLAVIAAPLFEELLFRGILYRGFRRSLDTRTAVFASALVFAIIHPALSFVPVFAMAVCAATVFELTGTLLAPILTHMIYNGIVIAIALRAGS